MVLNQEGCLQSLSLAYGNEVTFRATVVVVFTIIRDRNYLQDDENRGKSLAVVGSENGSAIREMLINYNRCINRTILIELIIGSGTIHKIMIEEICEN